MVSVAESHGLSADMAQRLIVQSCVGSGLLSKDTDKPIKALRKDVCVPGGSTEKAIAHLAENNVPRIIHDAIEKSLQANRDMKYVG